MAGVQPAPEQFPCRRGLVALGDSITVGEGQAMLGLQCQSWTLWLATARELPFTSLAVNGAIAADVASEQLARLRGPYDLCCLHVGVNDARGPDFDAAAFEHTLLEVTARTGEVADRLVMMTIPVDLGRPRAGASVVEANSAIRRVADRRGATLVSIEDLRGWRLVLPDAVHLTALGQVTLAQRAATALAAEGMPLRANPVDLGGAELGLRSSARYAVTGHALAVVRDLRRRAREGTLPGVPRISRREQ
jgi:lysophospholipase L1-like esterase